MQNLGFWSGGKQSRPGSPARLMKTVNARIKASKGFCLSVVKEPLHQAAYIPAQGKVSLSSAPAASLLEDTTLYQRVGFGTGT